MAPFKDVPICGRKNATVVIKKQSGFVDSAICINVYNSIREDDKRSAAKHVHIRNALKPCISIYTFSLLRFYYKWLVLGSIFFPTKIVHSFFKKFISALSPVTYEPEFTTACT